jgi:hypothetical protein
MSFSLIACVVVQGRTYEGSSSVVVLDRSEPPQEPPRISISYPLDDGKQNLVGEGTLLTIIGNVQAGSNPIQKIQILEGSNVLQEWPAQPGSFRVDLSNFGSPGRKSLKIRVVDSAGLYGEAQIVVNNDDNLLDSAAREFLRKYCAGDGGTVRFGNLQTGPYAKPVEIWLFQGVEPYQNLVESAAQFWTKYTGIQFKISPHDQHPSGDVYITICDRFSENPRPVAITQRSFGSDPREITYVRINLYKGWLDCPQDMQIGALTHELGHALVTASEIEEFGSRCVLWPILTDYRDQVIPTIIQRAIHLVYSYPPGWQP